MYFALRTHSRLLFAKNSSCMLQLVFNYNMAGDRRGVGNWSTEVFMDTHSVYGRSTLSPGFVGYEVGGATIMTEPVGTD